MTCTVKRLVFLTTVAWSNGYDISFTTDVNLIRDGSRFDPGRDYFFVFFLFLLNFCIFAACAIWFFVFILFKCKMFHVRLQCTNWDCMK